MGRSVIPHPQATVTAYAEFNPSHYCDDCETFTEDNSSCPDCGEYIGCDYSCDHSEEWREYLDWISETACAIFPSMSDVDSREVSRWSENYVIAENRHSEISVSEYGSLVAISLAPRSDLSDHWEEESQSLTIGAHWRSQVSERFLSAFGTLHKLGSMSNGEGVYAHV